MLLAILIYDDQRTIIFTILEELIVSNHSELGPQILPGMIEQELIFVAINLIQVFFVFFFKNVNVMRSLELMHRFDYKVLFILIIPKFFELSISERKHIKPWYTIILQIKVALIELKCLHLLTVGIKVAYIKSFLFNNQSLVLAHLLLVDNNDALGLLN